MTQFATDDEIRAAHDVLLPGKPDFEEDKLDVIRCNESCDIKACPGSGKTTVLLAKLSILSNKMPFADGSGVCVLTHTNVAIDEIKARFGGKADLLFDYPNFCGTIQSFVDRFLTIPWFNSYSPHPIVAVDDDRAIPIIKKAFYATSWEEQKVLNHLFRENREYIKACEEKRWDDVKKMKVELVVKTYIDIFKEKFYKNYGEGTSIASAGLKNTSPTFSFLHDVRLSAFKEGVLKYDDAYSVALAYSEMLPGIRDALATRFKYVFIDEVQDSSKLQLDLLDKVFDRDKVVVQRFGDPYQAIYNSERESDCAWNPINPLSLNKSKRFGPSIAKVTQTVCIEDNIEMEGNDDVHSIMPVMLVYTDGIKVLPYFAKLLQEKKVDGITVADIAREERKADVLHRINIKAVGYVGKVKEKDGASQSIHYYFPQFENQTTPTKPFEENASLNTFLQKNAVQDNPQDYRNHLLDALVSVLVRAGVKKDNGRQFSKTSMLDYLANTNPEVFNILIDNLSKWVLRICDSEYSVDAVVFDDVQSFISSVFADAFGFKANIGQLRQFLKKNDEVFYQVKNQEQSLNVYKDGDLEIEVATVHSVKGETHAATLFLETMYYKYESEHFGDQLCGEPYVHRKGEGHVLQSLKVAYVALSRPKYLLAYAIHKDRFDKLDREKLKKIWEIKEIK